MGKDLFRISRGPKSKLNLGVYELGYVTDEKALYIGSNEGPVRLTVPDKLVKLLESISRSQELGTQLYSVPVTEKSVTKRINVIQVTNELRVYVPSENDSEFIYYRLKRITDDSKNLDQWCLVGVKLVSKSNDTYTELRDLSSGDNWEGYVIDGSGARVGGVNGDEYFESISIMVDGKEEFDHYCEASSSVKVVLKSRLHELIGNNKTFTRYKILEWSVDGTFSIINKLVADRQYKILGCRTGVLALNNKLVRFSRNDIDYTKNDVSTSSPDVVKGCSEVELWDNTDIGIYSDIKLSNVQTISKDILQGYHYTKDGQISVYFDITGECTLSVGDVLYSETSIKILA